MIASTLLLAALAADPVADPRSVQAPTTRRVPAPTAGGETAPAEDRTSTPKTATEPGRTSAPARVGGEADPARRRQRRTFAPNNNGADSSQGQLTQNRSVTPSRFDVRNRPVPGFADPYPAAALGNGPRAGPFFTSRWAEDWSGLKGSADGTGSFFDALKYVPLAADGRVYATFSGEQRLRLNYTTNPGLRDVRAQEQYLVRNIVGADVHFGPRVRVFGEVANGIAFGSDGVDGSPQQDNDAIVQQLFAEASVPLGKSLLTLRVGRQEFMDGPPNIIHIRPAPDIYTSLDGVRLNVNTPRFRASLFDFDAVELGRGAFDDPSSDTEVFRGVSTSFVVPEFAVLGAKAKLFFDPFVWNHRNDEKRWGPTTARDDRNFYGARLWGTVGDATLDVSMIRQDGRFDDRDISAWGVFANAGYLLDDGPWHPRVGVHLDYTSGGGAYDDGTLRTFSFFYGSIPYFSWGNLIGPSNLADASANVRFTPVPRVSVTTEYSLLRRVDDSDAIYTFLETPLAGTQLVRGHSIGSLLRADVAWQADARILVALKMDVLIAGPVLERAGYANSTFIGPEIQFRF